MATETKAITWQQLKEFVNTLNEDQLSGVVRWWGDDQGGTVKFAAGLEEEFILGSDGWAETSAFTPEDMEEYDMHDTPRLPKDTPVLWVD